MQAIQSKIAIEINENVFKKDPLSSDLGNRMLTASIDLFDELGFEDFTFRKLAKSIGSTEASVYRYFDNKHNLLAYLLMWYWSWMEYSVVMATLNIEDPKIRLKRAINCVTKQVEADSTFQQIDEAKLHQIVVREAAKVYHCKSVDQDNKEGFFVVYKDLVERIAEIILEIKPGFKYPHMLVSTIIEGARHQRFFANHLPQLTDVVSGEDAVTNFYQELIEREIGIEGK